VKISKEEKDAIQVLKELGYQVKLQKPTTKKTFEVQIETLNEFMRVATVCDLKVKDAIEEALANWISKKRGNQK
jgi:Leu/Phe-tRNA-protein transferase